MPIRQRKTAWILGTVGLLGVVSWMVVASTGQRAWKGWNASAIDSSDDQIFEDLSAEEEAYTLWVRTIGESPDDALKAGLDLVRRYPNFLRTYQRLPDLCENRFSECRSVLTQVHPSDRRAEIHRDAALAAITAADERWISVVRSPVLDPSLARWVLDRLRRGSLEDLLARVEEEWAEMLSSDSLRSRRLTSDRPPPLDTTMAGPYFGSGYLAALRSDWERASSLLEEAERRAPDDDHVHRELARIAYFTGHQERFVASLETAIATAQERHDIEHEIILRGNLGLGYLQWQGDVERAADMFDASLARARALNMGRSIAIGGYRLANVRARQHRYEEALRILASVEESYSEALPERASELLSLRGQILVKTYRFSEAEGAIRASLDNARSHGDKIREAQTLLALAQLSTKMGRYDQAYAAADSALSIVGSYGARDYVISAHSVLGEVERLRGRYPSAERHFRIGLRAARSTASAMRIAEISRELGITALLIGDLESAALHFEQAHADGGRTSLEAADALYLTATTYAYYGNVELAAETYRRALDTIEDEEAALVGRIKLRLAHVEKETSHADSTLALLDEASSILRKDPLQQAMIDWVRGQVFLEIGDFPAALAAFRKAASSDTWLGSHWDVYYGQALALWRMQSRRDAEAAFRRAIADVEAKRAEVPTTAGRSYFAHDRVEPYEAYAAFLEEEGRIVEAINVGERARSRGLLDLIYTTQTARGEASGDPSAQVIEAVVRARALAGEHLDYVDGGASNDARAAFVAAEKETLAQRFARLEHSLRGTHPLYTFSPIALETVQTILRPNEAVLVYRLRETKGSSAAPSVVYVIRPDSVGYATLPLQHFSDGEGPSIADQVDRLNRSYRHFDESTVDDWARVSRDLFDRLVAPALPMLGAGTTHLHVVPSGALHYLPFPALLDSNGDFLVERYSFSTTPSLTILALCRDRNPGRWNRMLVLADPDGDLPGARHEARSIVASDTLNRRLIVGARATQQILEAEAPAHDIIHLATHGRFRRKTPLGSHLKLHGEELTVDEIGRLRLRAYLVTLSACETALSRGWHGDHTEGEEWVGMHQAFLAAGTPTVMASLWQIHDRYSGPLMSRFYSRLRQGGKAYALADVQREFIKDERLRHPYFWAGFVIIGDPL